MSIWERVIYTEDLSLFEIPKKSGFFPIVSRNIPPLIRFAFPFGICDEDRYEKHIGWKHHYNVYYDERDIFMDQDELDREQKTILHETNANLKVLHSKVKLCEKEGRSLLKFSKRKAKGHNFSKFLEEYFNKLIYFEVHLDYPLALQPYFENKIREEIITKTGSENNEYFNLLCSPIKPNINYFEQVELYKMACQYQKEKLSDNLRLQITTHAENFGQIGCKLGVGNLWTFDDVYSRVKNGAAENPMEKLKQIKDHIKDQEKTIKKILIELKADAKFCYFINVARNYVWLRTYRMDTISRSFANILDTIEKKNKDLTRQELIYCYPWEIINDQIPTKEIIEKRKPVVMFGKDSYVYYCNGKNAELVMDSHAKFSNNRLNYKSSDDKITGYSAFPGIAKGVVKLLFDNNDLNKVSAGDIIVAPMTAPNFVSAMEKAAAFVTDEGGILCHAAILSREMKKPCIIGTKIATKVFKDGDLIEVDAGKGIINIL